MMMEGSHGERKNKRGNRGTDMDDIPHSLPTGHTNDSRQDLSSRNKRIGYKIWNKNVGNPFTHKFEC